MRVEQAINQVKIARPAAASANSQRACEMRFGRGGKSTSLFMADVDPLNQSLPPNGVCDSVEAITDNAIDTLYASRCQSGCELISNSEGHRDLHWFATGLCLCVALKKILSEMLE
jgi:hypothetical protein